MNAVFDDPRDDGLDLFATHADELDTDYDLVVSNADHIGWLSSRDFRFLNDLLRKLNQEGIPFDYYTSDILKLSQIKRIAELLDEFVKERNQRSRSDVELNRSVRRLRSVIQDVFDRDANLLMVAD